MENCESILELMSISIDEPLSVEDQARLDAHLAECESCAKTFAMFHLIHEESGNLQEMPPVNIAENVMAAVRREKKPSAFRRFRFTTVAAIFALILLTASGGLNRFFPAETPDPAEPATASETPEYAVQSRAMPEAKIAEDYANTNATLQGARALPKTPYSEGFAFYITANSAEIPEFLSEAESVSDENRIYLKVSKEIRETLVEYLETAGIPFGFYEGESSAEHGILILEE